MRYCEEEQTSDDGKLTARRCIVTLPGTDNIVGELEFSEEGGEKSVARGMITCNKE